MKYDIKKSTYIKQYKTRMISTIRRINPSWNDEDIEEVLNDMIKKYLQNPVVEMDNNYTGEHKEASLISILDWTFEAKPILSGNGTFYKNQYQAINPVANMLMSMLARRKAYKKEMFKIEDTESDEYKDLDRSQGNEKVNCNSYYGASGAPTSAFYSLWSGPATTLTAQQVISTTENMFESFIADNYQFIDINEFFDWIESFLPDSPVIIDDWVKPVSRGDLYKRLKSKIIKLKKEDKDILRAFVDNLDDIDVKLVYYKNNLIQFVDDHKNVQELYRGIFENISNLEYFSKDSDWRSAITKLGYKPDKFKNTDEWEKFVNKEYFMNPNDVPDTVRKQVEKMCDILIRYIYVPYLPFDRVYRLKNFKRRTVTVIDTDSNILALDTWVNYTINNIMKSDYGRDKEKNIFIAVNTLTYMLTEAVGNILELYGKYANIPEEFRPKLNMKNEFEKSSCKTLLIDGELPLSLNYQTIVVTL